MPYTSKSNEEDSYSCWQKNAGVLSSFTFWTHTGAPLHNPHPNHSMTSHSTPLPYIILFNIYTQICIISYLLHFSFRLSNPTVRSSIGPEPGSRSCSVPISSLAPTWMPWALRRLTTRGSSEMNFVLPSSSWLLESLFGPSSWPPFTPKSCSLRVSSLSMTALMYCWRLGVEVRSLRHADRVTGSLSNPAFHLNSSREVRVCLWITTGCGQYIVPCVMCTTSCASGRLLIMLRLSLSISTKTLLSKTKIKWEQRLQDKGSCLSALFSDLHQICQILDCCTILKTFNRILSFSE